MNAMDFARYSPKQVQAHCANNCAPSGWIRTSPRTVATPLPAARGWKPRSHRGPRIPGLAHQPHRAPARRLVAARRGRQTGHGARIPVGDAAAHDLEWPGPAAVGGRMQGVARALPRRRMTHAMRAPSGDAHPLQGSRGPMRYGVLSARFLPLEPRPVTTSIAQHLTGSRSLGRMPLSATRHDDGV